MVPPFWVFPIWHVAHSDRKGPVGLVNGSVGTVTSRQHTGHRGGPAIVTSHNGRYLVFIQAVAPGDSLFLDAVYEFFLLTCVIILPQCTPLCGKDEECGTCVTHLTP